MFIFQKWMLLLFVFLIAGQASAHPSGHSRLHLLNELIHKKPEKASHYLHRAHANAEVGHWHAAFKDLEKAKKLGAVIPSDMLRGKFYQYQGNDEKSVAVYSEILEFNPNYLPALQERAKAFQKLNQADMALHDYLSVLKKQPELSSGTYITIAELMANENVSGWSNALELLDKRMQATGIVPQLQYFAITLEKQQKRYRQAIERMNSLSDLIKSTPRWHLDLARLYLLEGDKQKVKQKLLDAKKVLENKKNTPDVQGLKVEIQAVHTQLN